MELFVNTPKDGYHLTEKQISIAEEKYGAKYMGYWCTKRLDGGSWNERPVDVFYQPNPDTSKGHSNYFGLFVQEGNLWITNAASAFEEPITGIVCEDGEVIVSRFRHDYVTKGDRMIDGGRDYVRASLHASARITVVEDKFVVESNAVE
jgi:hypothetical protein